MLAHAADFVLDNDGIFSSVAIPPRDQLGRFLGNFVDDDEDCNDCVGSIFALVAETVTSDVGEESLETDEDVALEIDNDIDWYLSPDEQAEMDKLNLKHGTEYYKPKDLMTLRRLDGLKWVEETYGNYQNDEGKWSIPTKSKCSGSFGFGSGKKHTTYKLLDFYGAPGRRGHDDGRKQRKARFNRQLRENRKVRAINITV
ncbi:hypothetical protein K2P47_03860 [Patescibacteria group bacterium]|nr:hypothetical protein [Patescibacteria group bacterium]